MLSATLLGMLVVSQTFPPPGDWVPARGPFETALVDVQGDDAGGAQEAFDIVGELANPAGFFHTDGTSLSFRMRLADSPAQSSTKWKSWSGF